MMRITPLHILLASVCLAHVASAKPPVKPTYSQFSKLADKSPFTIKPTRIAPSVESPLERDWMLGSIRPSGNGHAVTLINKKDRKERIRFLPGFSTGEFQLVSVKQDQKAYKNSKVQIRKGNQTAWIGYDEKLIKVRPSVTSKASAKRPTISSKRSGPPIPGRTSSSKSSGRQRTVPKSGR